MAGADARRAYAREYAKKWRAANPEKHKAYQRKYSEQNREKENARKREWARKNPDKVKLYRDRYWARKAAAAEAAAAKEAEPNG